MVGTKMAIAAFGWMKRYRAELKLALRTTLAGLITFALAHLLQLPQGYWAVLTSVIIMQASIGGSLKAVIDRMLGTFAGAVWGVIVTLAVPHQGIVALALTLTLALGPLAVVAALRPAYRIAPVTAIIVLLSTSSQLGPLTYAIDRVLEIGLGCLVGFAVSLFVLPARAHRLLTEAAASAVESLAELTAIELHDPTAATDRAAMAGAHLRVRRAIAQVEALVEEAKRERANGLTDAADPEPVARNLRRLRHDLASAGRTLAEPLAAPGGEQLAGPLADLRQAILAFFAGCAAAFTGNLPPPPLDAVDVALDGLNAAMTGLRRSGRLRELSVDQAAQIFGLVFVLQQLRANLRDLADRVTESAGARTAPAP
jgi:uncharacterized membrane protein YccC